LLCSVISAGDPKLKEPKLPGVKLQNVPKLKTANFKNA